MLCLIFLITYYTNVIELVRYDTESLWKCVTIHCRSLSFGSPSLYVAMRHSTWHLACLSAALWNNNVYPDWRCATVRLSSFMRRMAVLCQCDRAPVFPVHKFLCQSALEWHVTSSTLLFWESALAPLPFFWVFHTHMYVPAWILMLFLVVLDSVELTSCAHFKLVLIIILFSKFFAAILESCAEKSLMYFRAYNGMSCVQSEGMHPALTYNQKNTLVT